MASRVTSRFRRTAKDDSAGTVVDLDPIQRKVRRLLAAGEHRAAIDVLRELAHRDQSGAGWVRLASALSAAGRIEAAIDALKQGAFLHRRYGDRKKAAVVRALIDGLRSRTERAA